MLSLLIYFIHSINSIYMSIPISQFIPPLWIHFIFFNVFIKNVTTMQATQNIFACIFTVVVLISISHNFNLCVFLVLTCANCLCLSVEIFMFLLYDESFFILWILDIMSRLFVLYKSYREYWHFAFKINLIKFRP